jgi:Zn-dependent protease/predicted transcriptional regulator
LGVEVRIDPSWVVIALLVTYSLYLQFVGDFRQLTAAGAVILSIVFALLFFGSVLTHEMAHAIASKRRGIAVRGITLFMFGGATHAKVESRRPRDEFIISIVGPLTSLVLGGIFIGVTFAIRDLNEPLAGGFLRLGAVNIILGVFNMLPGFPLDGGRVLRSIVWGATGDISKATKVASIAGQAVGYLLVAGGVYFLTIGAVGNAIWFAAIGWFLAQAARSSYLEIQVRRILETVEAEDLMSPDLVRIPTGISIRDAVDRYFMRYDHGAFPVENESRTIGLVSLRGIRRIPQEDWARTRIEEAMDEVGDNLVVERTARMDRVLEKLQEGERQRVLVTSDGEVVGIITPSDIARWLDRRRALGPP